MGYACPVCEAPQADGGHLANHLAFTATLGEDDHASWLDEHAPGWDEATPAALADRVTEHATETEYPQVFEDTTGEAADVHGSAGGTPNTAHDPADFADAADPTEPGGPGDPADLAGAFPDTADVDADDVLAEARDLTRRRRENAAADGSDGDGDGTATGEADGDDAEPDRNGERGGTAEFGDRGDGEPADSPDEDADGTG